MEKKPNINADMPRRPAGRKPKTEKRPPKPIDETIHRRARKRRPEDRPAEPVPKPRPEKPAKEGKRLDSDPENILGPGDEKPKSKKSEKIEWPWEGQIVNKRGRPLVIKPEMVKKLTYYFSLGMSDRLACQSLGISRPALNNFCERNPGARQYFESLKQQPARVARQNIIHAMQGDKTHGIPPDLALCRWWIEKRSREEFGSDNYLLEMDRRESAEDQGGRGYGGSVPAELVAPEFANFFRDVTAHKYTHYREPGGRGAGRSTAISLAVVNLVVNNPDIHAVLCRKVGNTIRDSVFSQTKWAIEALGLANQFKVNKSLFLITRVATGQQIYFRGLDDPNKIKSIRTPFGRIGVLWLEEADQTNGEEELRPVRQSVMRGGDDFWCFESWNTPRSRQHWINVRTEAEAGREDVRTHHSTYLSMPPEWLGKPFFDEAEALKASNEKAYRHEYLGEAIGYGGEVFERLSIETISDETIATFDNVKMGLDFGFAVDPLAFVKAHLDKTRKVLFIYDELVALNLTDEEAGRLIKARGVGGRNRIIADSADPKSIENYRRHGFYVTGCTKFPGSVEHGVKYMQGLTLIVIDPVRCPTAAREFSEYSYKKDKNGNYMPVLQTVNDHCIAEGQLVTTDKGKVPIEDVRPGDMVLTRGGYKRVLNAWCSGHDKPVVKIMVGDHSLVCTPNHEVFTENRGFVRADGLRFDDILLFGDSICQKPLKQLNIMEKSTEDIQIAIDYQINDIFIGMKLKEQLDFIEEFGKKHLVKYLMDIIYTIKMKIQLIIVLRILNVYQQANILSAIIPLKDWEKLDLIWKILDFYLRNGIRAQKVANGMQNMQNRISKILFQKKKFVKIVEKNIFQKYLSTMANFVLQNVNLLTEENQALITKSEYAQNVKQNFLLINMQKKNVVRKSVVCIEDGGIASKVYDLTIENNHEFFVNDILVHNCIDAVRYSLDDEINAYREASSQFISVI